MRLEWAAVAADGYDVWRTSNKTRIPELTVWGTPPEVRAVNACTANPDLVCLDTTAVPDAPSPVIFYQTPRTCCGIEGLDPEIVAMTEEVSSTNIADHIQTLVACAAMRRTRP